MQHQNTGVTAIALWKQGPAELKIDGSHPIVYNNFKLKLIVKTK